MGYFHILKPIYTRNLPLNARLANASNVGAFTNGGSATLSIVDAGDTVSSVVAQTRAGTKAGRIVTSTTGAGMWFKLEAAMANAAHMAAIYLYPITTLPSVLNLGFGNDATGADVSLVSTRAVDGTGWFRVYREFTGAQASGNQYLYLLMPNAGSLDCLVSAVMCYEGTTLRKWFSGFDPGCKHVGAHDASATICPEFHPITGRKMVGTGEIRALDDDEGIIVRLAQGTGIAPLTHKTQKVVGRPGSVLIDTQLDERAMELSIYLANEDRDELYDKRADIDALLQVANEFELWFTPDTDITYAIRAKYVGGMGHGEILGVADQEFAVQLEAGDPRWQELAPKTTKLNLTTTIANAYYLSKRADGEWTTFGSGVAAPVTCILRSPDGMVYFATSASGGSAKLYKWDGYAVTQLGTFAGGGIQINALARSHDGKWLFILGDFTSINGSSGYNYISRYDLVNGNFASAAMGADGAGLNGIGYDAAVSPDGATLWVGFAGTTAGGVTVNRLAAYNIAANTFSAIKSGASGTVRQVLVLGNGRGDVVFAGDFATASVPSTITSLTVTRNNGAGTMTGVYKRYVVTSMSGTGETVVDALSLSSQWKLGSPGGVGAYAFDLSWTADPNATKYRVYATAPSGVDPNPTLAGNAPDLYLMAEVPAGTVTFRDDGSYTLSNTLWPLSSNGYVNTAGTRSARIGLYRPDEGAFYSLGGAGFNGSIRALAEGRDGAIYAGGDATEVDGIDIGRVAVWRGALWQSLGTGVAGGQVNAILPLLDGSTLVGGLHTSAGGYTDGAKLARFVGQEAAGQFVPLDIDLSAYAVYALAQDEYGDLYVGHSRSGSVTAAGVTTVSYSGTWDSSPQLIIDGPAVLGVVSNETLKQAILMRLTLLAGERLTVDPETGQVWTNSRDNVFDTLLLGTYLRRWRLRPGNNKITFFARSTDSNTRAVLSGAPMHIAGES